MANIQTIYEVAIRYVCKMCMKYAYQENWKEQTTLVFSAVFLYFFHFYTRSLTWLQI